MWFLIILYFVLLLIFTLISFRYLYLIVGFFVNRRFWSLKTPRLKRYPKVCVQLPVYNEPFVVERLIRSCAKLIWPKDKLEIQVLDDSTDKTSNIVSKLVSELSKDGINIKHIRRGSREGFKAGALKYGMELSDAEYFAIFDADFIPPADFLIRTIPFLENDPKLAGVQTRWDFINWESNLFTRAQRFMLNLHFVLEQFVRSREGLWLTFNGTGGILRRSALEWVGGWETDTLTEDADLSFRLYKKGYRILYLPDVTCKSELPDSPVAFKSQQRRWAKGGAQVFKKYFREMWRNNMPLSWKMEFMFQTFGNIGYPMGMILLTLLPYVLYTKFKGYYPELFLFMGILAVMDILVVWLAFAIANYQYRRDISEIFFTPLGMALVSGLTLNNTFAFFEGLIGDKGTFERTPKAGDMGMIINDVSKKLGISKIELVWGSYLTLISILSVFLNQLILGIALGVSGFGILWIGSSSYLQILGYEAFDLVLDEETKA